MAIGYTHFMIDFCTSRLTSELYEMEDKEKSLLRQIEKLNEKEISN